MAFRHSVEIEYSGLPALLASSTSRVRRMLRRWEAQSLEETTLFWKRRFFKEHFRQSATARYGYAERTKRHKARKFKLYGHRTPGVFTGEAMRMAMATETKPRSSRAGGILIATLPIKAPRYVWIMHNKKKSNAYRVGEEWVRTIPVEEDALSKFMAERLHRRLSRGSLGERLRRRVA